MVADKKTILVVDDQDGVRQLLQELLVNEGFLVYTACNGYQALEVMETSCPAILLMDMKMPGMSGIDVLVAMQNKENRCSPVIIMMTAYGEMEIIREARNLGVSEFITKPFDIDELRELVNKVAEATALKTVD